MKFAHIRVSEYLTFAEQIFHSEAISLAQRANFVEKRGYEKDIFRELPLGFELKRIKSSKTDALMFSFSQKQIYQHPIFSFCPNYQSYQN